MKRLALAACVLALMGSRADTQTGYPSGALPLASVFVGANTAGVSMNMPYLAPPPPNKTTYICGFNVSGLGATALTNVSITVNSVQRGDGVAAGLTFEYQYPAGATVLAVPVTVTFTPCLPAISPGLQLPVSVGGAAGNTLININMWGYAL